MSLSFITYTQMKWRDEDESTNLHEVREAGRDLSLSLIILIERGYLVTSQHKSLDAIFVNGGQTDDSTTGPISADGKTDT